MPRKGEQLERWARENIRGVSTKNSGATYEDADMKVDGVGGRLYEFKSSETTAGISINRVDVRTLLERAIKLNREPVFIFQNSKHERYALTPMKILHAAIDRWDAVGFNPQSVQAIKIAMSTAPMIDAKGNNIRIKDWELTGAIDKNGFLIYRTKNSIPWAIIEVDTWLSIVGDKKKEEG